MAQSVPEDSTPKSSTPDKECKETDKDNTLTEDQLKRMREDIRTSDLESRFARQVITQEDSVS